MATKQGESPTDIATPGVPEEMAIGVTVPPSWFATYAVTPFGVMATPRGPPPEWITGPGTSVATSIGVTVPSPLFAT